jgi:hypothetical protein
MGVIGALRASDIRGLGQAEDREGRRILMRARGLVRGGRLRALVVRKGEGVRWSERVV